MSARHSLVDFEMDLIATSLNLIVGFGGMVCFGHAAFQNGGGGPAGWRSEPTCVSPSGLQLPVGAGCATGPGPACGAASTTCITGHRAR